MHAGEYLDATIEARKILKIEMVAHTVGSIDGFLLATILLIFAATIVWRINTYLIIEIEQCYSNWAQKSISA
jgi:hypothetical protein